MKYISTLFLILFFASKPASAQLDKMVKTLGASNNQALANAQKQLLTNSLANFDKSLIQKFGLDGAKTEVVGNLLKIKVADKDFAKMTNLQKSNLANNINGLSGDMLKQLGDKVLNSLGLSKITNVVVELASGLGANSTKILEKVFPRK
ncbi:MAG: hypothetical protein LCH37_13665 [Bacteroidetes bacterium]|nr:hypothetical protein [Bacteroidota bacterium]